MSEKSSEDGDKETNREGTSSDQSKDTESDEANVTQFSGHLVCNDDSDSKSTQSDEDGGDE